MAYERNESIYLLLLHLNRGEMSGDGGRNLSSSAALDRGVHLLLLHCTEGMISIGAY
jgi:hypothetical protein